MMDIKKSFGSDKEKSENGKWFDLEEGGTVKVARLSCLAFKAEVQRLQKPFLAVLNSQVDTSDISDKLTIRAMAKTILVDWKHISIDGKPVEYSPENSEMLLKEYPDFKEMISALSADRRHYALEEITEK